MNIYIVGKFCGSKVWRINRSPNRSLIVSTNLNGFSLVNHGRFAKFTKLSPHQTFLLYNIAILQLLKTVKFHKMKFCIANYNT